MTGGLVRMEVAELDQCLHQAECRAAVHFGTFRNLGDRQLDLLSREALQHGEGLGH
jgi:hypothetical protein